MTGASVAVRDADSVDRCGACGAPTQRLGSEGVHGGRLVWSVEVRCGTCGVREIIDGWDELPEEVRAALIAEYGQTRLRLDRASAGQLRVRLLAALRASGGSIADAVDMFERLIGDGLTGTDAEMRLLASRLTAVGATVHLE